MGFTCAANAVSIDDVKVLKHNYVLVCDDWNKNGTEMISTNSIFGNGFFYTSTGHDKANNRGSIDLSTVDEIGVVTQEITDKYTEYGSHLNSLRLKSTQDVMALKVTARSKLIIFYEKNEEADNCYPIISKTVDMKEPLSSEENVQVKGAYGKKQCGRFEWTAADDGLIYIGAENQIFVSYIIVEANEAPGTPSVKVGEQTYKDGLWFREVTCKAVLATEEGSDEKIPTIVTYTTNGMAPTASSEVYTGPIKVYEDQTVKFQAFLDFGSGKPEDDFIIDGADNEAIVSFQFDAPTISAEGAKVTITSPYEGAKNFVTLDGNLDHAEECSTLILKKPALVTAFSMIVNGSYTTFVTKSVSKDINSYGYAEEIYCGTIPTLNFQCPAGVSIVSYDASTLKKDVGTYLIPVTCLANGTTYDGYAVVEIAKKPLKVTAHNKTREYGDANPELTIGYDGFVAGESVADLLTPPQVKTAADTSSPAGKYDITVDGAISNNYEIIYQKGTLTVSKAPLSIVVNNTTKEYGDANPTFTSTYHGLKNGESYPAWSTAPTYKTDATTTSGVGTYPVSLVNGEAKNYEINNRTDGVLTITPASLTVTAKDVTRQYGDENPAFTYSYAGFKGSDNENTLSAKPQGATSANKKSDVGNYAITASSASSPNYTITYKNGVLHVTQAPLTVKPYDVNRLYGENNPTFTFSYTGFKNGENEAVLDTKPTASAPGRETSVGTYTIQASGATAKNYAITHVNGTLSIGKAPLVATANNSTREYGDANPTFTATYSGFVNGDTEASLASKPSFTTSATRYSDVGTYDIVPTGGSAKNYYFSEYGKGTLTITPASLLVKANNQQRLFYEENPTLTYTCVGFKNSDNSSVFTTRPQMECEATMISDAGEYPITISGAACKNYTLGYENATMTVKKRTLQVTPADATRKYGEANPKFTCTLQGFVRNQNESVIAEMPEIYTTATTTSDVGRYDILSRGGSAVNYDFNYSKKGVLTIEKADQSIVWEQDLSRIAVGEQVELQAYATSGLDIEYVFDTDIASIYRVGSKRYLDCYGIGTFVLRASQPGNNNYEAAVRVAKTVVIDSATGINDATETIGNGEPFDVYDLNGRKVRYQTTSLKDLPRGVYVVNGRKVVK